MREGYRDDKMINSDGKKKNIGMLKRSLGLFILVLQPNRMCELQGVLTLLDSHHHLTLLRAWT